VVLLPATGACGDWIAGPSITNWGDGGAGGSYDYPFQLTDVPNVVAGDSMRVSVWASSGDASATWELTGPAVFVLRTGAVTTRIPSSVSDVWIRGTGSGAASVKAVRNNSVDSATASFYVADASEVRLRVVQGGALTIRVGADGSVVANLLDSQNRCYAGAFQWSSTDTNVVTIAEDANHSPFGKFAHGQAAGSAKIVIVYRDQRDSAFVTVVP
jgi:hypothetical protein